MTTSLSAYPRITNRVRPPRVLEIHRPRGATVGGAKDARSHRRTVEAALGLMEEAKAPARARLDDA